MTERGARERLLAAAREELIATGGRLEMQAVARRAESSVGLAYYHFGSKAGLLAGVVEDFYQRLFAATSRAAEAHRASWSARERARLHVFLAFHLDEPLARVVVNGLGRTDEVMQVEAATFAAQLSESARNLKAAQRDGIIPRDLDPELTGALLLGGVRQALIACLAQEKPEPADVLTGKIWTFIEGALRLRRFGAERTRGRAHVTSNRTT